MRGTLNAPMDARSPFGPTVTRFPVITSETTIATTAMADEPQRPVASPTRMVVATIAAVITNKIGCGRLVPDHATRSLELVGIGIAAAGSGWPTASDVAKTPVASMKTTTVASESTSSTALSVDGPDGAAPLRFAVTRAMLDAAATPQSMPPVTAPPAA